MQYGPDQWLESLQRARKPTCGELVSLSGLAHRRDKVVP